MLDIFFNFINNTGFTGLSVGTLVMIAIACILLYLAIVKKFEPLLLVPIAFGVLLTNLPYAGLMAEPVMHIKEVVTNGVQTHIIETVEPGGLLYYLFQGDHLGIFPPIIFMGVGAMTDFGPLIANPRSLLLGAAAQFGIFVTFIGAIASGMFTAQEAASIGIIGGADGPTAIFLSSRLSPHLLGPIAIAAYSYMALVPIIQPPIMRFLTTEKERMIRMTQLREVSKREKILFPILVTIVVTLMVPAAGSLIGMLMLGNLFRECGVTARLEETAKNALINIITIFLGTTVGATATAEYFLTPKTLAILALGVIAFAIGTASGVLLAKVMNKFFNLNINPLIGSAGVSAVPMAARVSQVEGQKADPGNFLLMHAMGPNVAGVIGSAVSAGVLLSMFGG